MKVASFVGICRGRGVQLCQSCGSWIKKGLYIVLSVQCMYRRYTYICMCIYLCIELHVSGTK